MWNPLRKSGRLDHLFQRDGGHRTKLPGCSCDIHCCVMHENERNRAHLPLLIMQDSKPPREERTRKNKAFFLAVVYFSRLSNCHFSLRPRWRFSPPLGEVATLQTLHRAIPHLGSWTTVDVSGCYILRYFKSPKIYVSGVCLKVEFWKNSRSFTSEKNVRTNVVCNDQLQRQAEYLWVG